MNPKRFFKSDEQEAIEAAIKSAEQMTSAEIKLIILRHCWQDIKVKAVELFRKYRLYDTQERNAVLVLLVTTNREFLIYGDEGINTKVGQKFWDDVKDQMQSHFSDNSFGIGLQKGIEKIGEKLKNYYPCQLDDNNEIDNGVAYEE
ncbi:MAG: TPM domain-containing protein [Planctomycetota bacterium]